MKKIVLTANDDRGLDGAMSMHFGHCTHFVVVHVDAANRVAATEVHPNPFAARHEPGQIPQYIGSLGADVVVAGGMGSKAIAWFRQFGIEVATGARVRAWPKPWTPSSPVPLPAPRSATIRTER